MEWRDRGQPIAIVSEAHKGSETGRSRGQPTGCSEEPGLTSFALVTRFGGSVVLKETPVALAHCRSFFAVRGGKGFQVNARVIGATTGA